MLHSHEHGRLNLALHNRTDPTKTTTLRGRYERDLIRRLRKIAKQIREIVIEDDAFGFNSALVTNAGQFDFPRSSQKVAAFIAWLNRQQNAGILEITPGQTLESAAETSWQKIYLRSAYQKGLSSAASQMRKGGVEVTDRWLDSAFFRPIHADRAGLIYTRAFSELTGITTTMADRMSSTLAQAIVEGVGMREVSARLVADVGKIGIVRARRLARTEIIRSHAEATLNGYEEAKIEGVEVLSEFTTAGDDRVCVTCQALEGKVFTVDEARGVIPVHPNCRCAWLPIVKDPGTMKLL